ncbi:hypothetical protein PaG_05050 [Moesziomyces aphidis]|uniref:GDP-mannose transporter n=1 Tax=Moesziomyces aphidis TaxID=84754 RepID=W3VHG4_MOEAP|nr:hypothetical protein PaG_05050 [Moesziomyces aphidis]
MRPKQRPPLRSHSNTHTRNAAPSKVGRESEGSVDHDNQRAPVRTIVRLHIVLLACLQPDPLSAADDQSNADSPAARRDIFRPLDKVRSAIAISAQRTGLAAIPSSHPARNQSFSPGVNSLRSGLRCCHHLRSLHSPLHPERHQGLPHLPFQLAVKMASGNRSFFAPQETRVDLPHGAATQTPDITRPASPSENDRAPFLNGGEGSREDVRMGAKALRHDADKPAVGVMALAPILSYCAASITMTVVNKFTVSGAGFNMNLLVLLIQSTVGVTCVMIAERAGLIQLRGLNSRDVWNWMPLSTMLVFVIWTGSKALQYLNISVYTIFKNLTIILIAYGEVLWFGGRVTRIVLSSFLLMVLSSIIAAWSDISNVFAIGNLSMPHTPDSIAGGMSKDPNTGALIPAFDPLKAEKDAIAAQIQGASANDVIEGFQGYGLLSSGYLWMALNCICSATYVLLMRKRIKVTGFKDWDTMFYNNFLSIPVLLVMSFLVEDWSAANLHKNFPDDKQTKLISAIVFSGACAILISYTTAWCIRATSSTTYSMVGALNKLPVALSGMVFFHDPPVTFSSVSAISVGFFAGLVYAVGKNKQAEAAKLAGTSASNGSSSSGSKDGSSLPMHNLNDRKD